MPKFLIATHPITGHMLPAVPIVSELVRRGHEVRWYSGRKFREQVEAAGAVHEQYHQAYDFDDADYGHAFPGRNRLTGLDRVRFDLLRLYVDQVARQHRDLEHLLEDFEADAVLGDPWLFAALTLTERGGPPNALYNVTCLGLPGRDVPPFGLGLPPSTTLRGRVRNRALQALASNLIFGKVSVALAEQCAAVGAAPRPFRGPPVSPYLYLQPSVPSLEYPRTDLPPQVHFVGSLPAPAGDGAVPDWWDEVAAADRPVVLVAPGPGGPSVRELLLPAVRGLASEDVLVVAAGVRDAALLGTLPPNVRTTASVPLGALLPHVSAVVTGGGYDVVQHALSAGVPVVTAGRGHDAAEVGNRIAYSGVGLHVSSLRPPHLRDAVRSVLTQLGYRERAGEVRDELSRHDGPVESADLLERLAATRRAVFR